MFKADLFNRVNDRRRAMSLALITREEFIAALSSLETSGFIVTEGDQCHPAKEYDTEVTNDHDITSQN